MAAQSQAHRRASAALCHELAAVSLVELRRRSAWLHDVALQHPSALVRRSALGALCRAGHELTGPIARKVLETELRNENLRQTAIHALGEVGGPDDEPYLEGLAHQGVHPADAASARQALRRLRRRELVTLGYGVASRPGRGVSQSELFVACVAAAKVRLVLDVRYSPWGRYWNPRRFLELLEPLQGVGYLHEESETRWHRVFGASPEIREKTGQEFAQPYLKEVGDRAPDAWERLVRLVDRWRRVAILCCEPYRPERDHCHRFVMADEMLRRGLLRRSEVRDASPDLDRAYRDYVADRLATRVSPGAAS